MSILLELDPIILSVLVMALVMLVVLAAYAALAFSRKSRDLKDRLLRVGNQAEASVEAAAKLSLRRNDSDSSIATLDKIVKAIMPRPAQLRARLARTGKNISMGVFFLSNLLIMGLTVLGLMHFTKLPALPVLLIGLALGVMLPRLFVTRLINKRLKRFNNQFPDAVDIVVRGLKAGLPVTESIKIVGNEIKGPVADEFTRVSEGVRLGRTLDEMLWQVVARVEIPEFKFFVISMSVQKETGGNLAETLANLSDILRKRRGMRGKIRALSSEARASAIIIGSLPFIMFGVIFSMNRGYVMQLITDPRGPFLLAAGVLSMTIGIVTMVKMIKFEV